MQLSKKYISLKFYYVYDLQDVLCMKPNGYVYETFGISKHFPVKLQLIMMRAKMFDNALIAKCFIYDVVCWALFIIN